MTAKDEGPKFNWQRLEEQAVVLAEQAKPSSEPGFWAKKSCNKCLGRGIHGSITTKIGTNTMKTGLICECAKKRFVKWRNDWVFEYCKKERAKATLESAPAILESVESVDKKL